MILSANSRWARTRRAYKTGNREEFFGRFPASSFYSRKWPIFSSSHVSSGYDMWRTPKDWLPRSVPRTFLKQIILLTFIFPYCPLPTNSLQTFIQTFTKLHSVLVNAVLVSLPEVRCQTVVVKIAVHSPINFSSPHYNAGVCHFNAHLVFQLQQEEISPVTLLLFSSYFYFRIANQKALSTFSLVCCYIYFVFIVHQ